VVRRFVKKSRKYRGWRTHGWGRVGQHRKSGSSGGRGRVGLFKHKKSWLLIHAEDNSGYPLVGKHGFTQPVRAERRAINVGQLDSMIDSLLNKGLVSIEGGVYVVDLLRLGYNKLLGGGRVTKPMLVRVPWASRIAGEKLRRVGGSVELVKGVLHA